MIQVLLVDDLPPLRAGFRMVLDAQDDIRVVGEAPDGAAAVEAAGRLVPDVVLMDVRMPRLDGIEATRQIVTGTPDARPRVLILTTFDLDEYVYAGLRAGASGFLLKNAPPNELVAAIRAVARGDAVVAPTVTRRLLDSYAHRLRTVPFAESGSPVDHPALAPLTPREREVLVEIAQGYTNPEIAERLVLAETTVKTHVGRILQKLELRDRVHAVILAYEIGLRAISDRARLHRTPGGIHCPFDRDRGGSVKGESFPRYSHESLANAGLLRCWWRWLRGVLRAPGQRVGQHMQMTQDATIVAPLRWYRG